MDTKRLDRTLENLVDNRSLKFPLQKIDIEGILTDMPGGMDKIKAKIIIDRLIGIEQQLNKLLELLGIGLQAKGEELII